MANKLKALIGEQGAKPSRETLSANVSGPHRRLALHPRDAFSGSLGCLSFLQPLFHLSLDSLFSSRQVD